MEYRWTAPIEDLVSRPIVARPPRLHDTLDRRPRMPRARGRRFKYAQHQSPSSSIPASRELMELIRAQKLDHETIEDTLRRLAGITPRVPLRD